MESEVWKAVVGWEGLYEVSNLGRVRSIDRVVVEKTGKEKRLKGTLLKPSLDGKGYPFVNLSRSGRVTASRIHRLSAAAFLGPIPADKDVCHNDGTRTNNRIENLRIDTRAGNLADCVKHGTHLRGERCNLSKLTSFEVLAIRKDARHRREVARTYGISPGTVSDIKTRRSWSWLPDEEEAA